MKSLVEYIGRAPKCKPGNQAPGKALPLVVPEKSFAYPFWAKKIVELKDSRNLRTGLSSSI